MAAAKKGGLGKGLDSLIADKVNKPAVNVASISEKNEKAVDGRSEEHTSELQSRE